MLKNKFYILIVASCVISKEIKESDTWSFINLLHDDGNVLQNDFESLILEPAWDSSRDGLNHNNFNKKTVKLPTVQDVWQWLFRYSKKKTTVTTTTKTTEKTTTESYPISIGRVRRPPKYKRTCKEIIKKD